MNNKLGKYFVYIKQFIKSPIKKVIVYELYSEIKLRGLIQGIQSFLHKRAQYFFPGYDTQSSYDPIISLKKFNKSYRVVLPDSLEPKVSIIIPMYNQLEYTYYCIRSINEHEELRDYEVIIANDNSTESTEFLERHLENVNIITNEKNLGFLKNCNNAAKHARGEYLVFLNNDTVIRKGWLSELLLVFEKYKDVGLVGSKLVYPDGTLQEAGGIIWQNGTGWNFGRNDNPDKPQYNYIKEVDYISGASVMIKKSLWEDIGGFDEHYSPAYYEDTDLCFAVRNKGYKVMYTPFSEVVHFEGKSHGTDLKKGIKRFEVINRQKFVEKWKDELKLKSKKNHNIFFERDRTLGKKHILVVDHDIPTIDQDAGSRTMSNFVDIVLALGYKVTFLSSNPGPQHKYKRFLQEKGVEVLWGAEDYGFFGQGVQNYLHKTMHNFDAVLLSRSSTCIPFMIFLRNNNYKGNILYYGHDLGYLRIDQERALNRDLSLDLNSKRLKADEDFMYEHADHSLVISYEELTYLRKYISQPLHYFPFFFFDIEENRAPFEDRDGLLFIGGFNHTPNQDAMTWFLDEVYETLHEQNIKLTICGSNIPSYFFEYKKQFKLLNIISNISVENLNKLYSKTKISVIPLRVGAGVKGKVIEAMCKGVPIVGSFLAFEGIPKDEHFLYKGCNTPGEIIDNILSIYYNKKSWEKLSDFGQEYVRQHFNKEGMKNSLNKILEPKKTTVKETA
jgi:O-antigen biosynthesis protein